MGMGWAIHIHLIAAIAWIGGSIFMFALGVSMRDKRAQKAVYPHIGPIFGYFEVVALMFLLATGSYMITDYGLIELLFTDYHSPVIDALRTKLWIVLILLIVTVIHFTIALKTNNRERTRAEHMISRASSMLIFFLNLFVLHYAMVIRDIL
jgi:putative copper export protein